MRIEQLEYLAAVVRHGSMRRAGEELHVSQAALSEAIRNLEREFGAPLLVRRRSGAKISSLGRELLPYVTEVLESVARLRWMAGETHRARRVIHIGTVNAATVPVVAPAIRDFRKRYPDAQVEVVSAQQSEIHQSLLDGTIELGLVNLMAGDVAPPDLSSVELVHGNAVVCCRVDSPLARSDSVTIADLRREPFVFMRAGYVMHRYMERAFGAKRPTASYVADGAEMGKMMVANGLGVTVLPDYSVRDDPLERAGILTHRSLVADHTGVVLTLLSGASAHRSPAIVDLDTALRRRARMLAAASAIVGPGRDNGQHGDGGRLTGAGRAARPA